MTSTTTDLVIRNGLPEEREAIIALTLAAYKQYDAVLPPGAWHEYATSIRDTFSNDTASTRVIVIQDDAIIGSALLIPPTELARSGRAAQPYPEIRLVAVAPEARRRGIATALIDACIERAQAAGYHYIGLHSTDYMRDAIRIYERLGFIRALEHDFHSPTGVHVMGFRLNIAAYADKPERS